MIIQKIAMYLKSVRDHYNHLEKEQKRKIRKEEKPSGFATEYSAFVIPWRILLRDSRPEMKKTNGRLQLIRRKPMQMLL